MPLRLSPAAHAAITSSHSIVADTSSGAFSGLPQGPFVNVETYGYGWWRKVYRNHLIIYHPGGLTGYGSLVLYILRQEWGIAMMANTAGTSTFVQIVLAYHLIDELLNAPEREWVDWTALMDQEALAQEERVKAAPARLFPQTPDPPLPPILSFKGYEGTYTHPAYGSLIFTYHKASVGSKSDARRTQSTHHLKTTIMRTREINIDLTHVSGEFWLLCLMLGEGAEEIETGKAQFGIGVDGQVEEVGFEMEGDMRLLKEGAML